MSHHSTPIARGCEQRGSEGQNIIGGEGHRKWSVQSEAVMRRRECERALLGLNPNIGLENGGLFPWPAVEPALKGLTAASTTVQTLLSPPTSL